MHVIHQYKYKGKTQLAEPLGRILFYQFISAFDPQSVDYVIPVPLHMKRMRKRGFNQSYLLVNRWDEWMKNIDPSWEGRVDRHILVRHRWTEPQTGLGRKNRKKNMKGAFGLTQPVSVVNKRILLVDDVFTTGATVDECAGLLLKAGAEAVDVLTLARA
jgi:ComF family protein